MTVWYAGLGGNAWQNYTETRGQQHINCTDSTLQRPPVNAVSRNNGVCCENDTKYIQRHFLGEIQYSLWLRQNVHVRYRTVLYRTVRYGRYGTVGTVRYSTVPYRIVQYRTRTVPYPTVPYRTVLYRTVPHPTVPYRTVPWTNCVAFLTSHLNFVLHPFIPFSSLNPISIP